MPDVSVAGVRSRPRARSRSDGRWMFGLRQRHRTRPARTALPRVRRRLLLPHRRASRSSIGTLLHGVRKRYAVSLHPQETLHPTALHPCVHPCPPPQHTHMHCARALHQHFHRPPFAIMASDADWPPLPSERRSSAVYQPMVRLPTFRCVTPTYNRSAPAPAPLTNSYIQHNILHQAPAARAVTTGGARGLPCRPEGGGRARPAGKACLLNRTLP